MFLCPIGLVFLSSSGSFPVLWDELLRYISRGFYRVDLESVPVQANFVPSSGPLAVVPYNLLDGVLTLFVSQLSVFGCHNLSFRRICRIFAILWRGVRCVTDPVYGLRVVDSVLIDSGGILSDFHYSVPGRFLGLQLTIGGCFNAFGSWCTDCQERFVYEDQLFNDKLLFGCFPSVVVSFVSRLFFTRSHVYLRLHCIVSTLP